MFLGSRHTYAPTFRDSHHSPSRIRNRLGDPCLIGNSSSDSMSVFHFEVADGNGECGSSNISWSLKKNARRVQLDGLQRYRPIFFWYKEKNRVQVFQSSNLGNTAALVCTRVVEVEWAVGREPRRSIKCNNGLIHAYVSAKHVLRADSLTAKSVRTQRIAFSH